MSFDKKEAPMKIGYVRVSKHEQNEYLQIDALKKEGCEKWFVDTITGSKFERKGLKRVLQSGFFPFAKHALRNCFGMRGGNAAWPKSKIGEVFAQV